MATGGQQPETSPSQESPAQTRHASLPDVTDTAPATGQALAVKQSKTPSEIALRALSPEIEEYLDVDIILPHLLRCHLLTKYEQEEHLFFPRDRTRKTRDLIIRLSNKGPKAFDLFVECLINSSEGHSSHRELAMKLKAEKEKAEQDLAKRKGGSGEKRQEAEEELQAQQRSQSFDEKPTLPQLTALQGKTRHINIVEGIGVEWMMVGTTLLDDNDGTIIPAIAEQYGNNAELINMEILERWVQGKGMPDRTWRGLLRVLRVHCVALAERVKEALTAKQAEPSSAFPSSRKAVSTQRSLPGATIHSPQPATKLDARQTSALQRKPVTPWLVSSATMLPNNPGTLVDSVEVIVCDEKGGIYHNPAHGLTIQIPSGAIPVGMKLEISMGVLLHGNFNFPADLSPVSAIIWLCTENPDFVFLEQIKVSIPHCMECKGNVEAARLQMKFMKASHFRSSADSFKFDLADGVPDFDTDTSKGILHTRHLCLLCIVAGTSPEYLQSRRFCISCAHPYPSITAPAVILFFVTYFLKTCLKHMHSKLPRGYQITHRRIFHFQSQSDSISGDSECQCSETFVVPLQPSTIARERLDFWKLHREGELELMEDNDLYPPRMTLEIAELPSVMRVIKVTFKGTRETEKETMIAIKVPSKTTSSPSTPMHPQHQTPISMGDYEAKIPAAKRGCVVSTPTQIANIAKEMNTWKSVSHRLVSDAEAEEIRNNNPTDYLEQKKRALKTWSESLGHEATYVALMRIFYEDKNITMVEVLIRQLNTLEL